MRKGLVIILGSIALMLLSTGYTVIKEKELLSAYRNDRFGYTYLTLKLYTDSTYEFSRWNHSRHVSDQGNWRHDTGGLYYLDSSGKTRWQGRGGKSKKITLFEKKQFAFKGDTIKIVSTKDDVFFDVNYELYRYVE
jgi:hypothetical protein